MATPTSPEISLLIATWNPDPARLGEAVRTALAQEDVDHEVVVIDDESREEVAPLLAGINDPRLRVHRIAHGGAAAARNAGMEFARGRFLRFLDDDDATPPGGTALLRRLIGEDRVIAYGATAFCDGDLAPIWTMRSTLRGHIAEACLETRFTVRTPALLFPREVIDASGPWPAGARVSEDWDFTLRALEHAPVRGTTEVVALYRKHGGSATGTSSATFGLAASMEVIDGYLERHPQARGTAVERRARAAAHATAARAALTRREPAQALAQLRHASVPAVTREVGRALPAVAGHLRRRLR